MGAAIELEGVGKRYLLGEHHGGGTDLRDAFARAVGSVTRRRQRGPRREFWSLSDVSLSVEEGQAIGVLGRNGAGKSTLLKVISNITTPTVGRCRTRGRVGSLLEVGTGFHADLTGLENTYLNGAILGMSRKAVTQRLDDIVSFAGLEGFMETPVKRYSSGMYLRLGFAIAAHMDADILVVDEVLAVGDAEFQQRCLGKMREVEASGRTVVFVSHDLDAITRLCPTSVWLEHGRVQQIGPTPEVVDAYLKPPGSGATASVFDVEGPDGRAALHSVELIDSVGRAVSTFAAGEPIEAHIDLDVRESWPGLDLAVVIINRRGVTVVDDQLRTSTDLGNTHFTPGRHRLAFELPPFLAAGGYTITLWMGDAYDLGRYYEQAMSFTVAGTEPNERTIRWGRPWRVLTD
ncbi:MAG TPA: ABC transporter ATP-binding protein [Ilumatobacter sp.]|nr:ABC transporter ATP-binding protein [Ilumatobacter sp.]